MPPQDHDHDFEVEWDDLLRDVPLIVTSTTTAHDGNDLDAYLADVPGPGSDELSTEGSIPIDDTHTDDVEALLGTVTVPQAQTFHGEPTSLYTELGEEWRLTRGNTYQAGGRRI